jgi:hypothetical protein
MDPISFDDEIIHWSGFVFSFWAERGRERILCKVKREAIREFPEFKHANRREIAIEAGHRGATRADPQEKNRGWRIFAQEQRDTKGRGGYRCRCPAIQPLTHKKTGEN